MNRKESDFRLSRKERRAVNKLIDREAGSFLNERDLPSAADSEAANNGSGGRFWKGMAASPWLRGVAAVLGIGGAIGGAAYAAEVFQNPHVVHAGEPNPTDAPLPTPRINNPGNPTPTFPPGEGPIPIGPPQQPGEPTPAPIPSVRPHPPTPTPFIPTPVPTPAEFEVQVITKKILLNPDGSGGVGVDQNYIAYKDLNRNRYPDPGEPFKGGRTKSGLDVLQFKGKPGDQFCSRENSIPEEWEPVVDQACDEVDANLTAENVLVNKNKLPKIPATLPPATPTPTKPPRLETPPPATPKPTPEATPPSKPRTPEPTRKPVPVAPVATPAPTPAPPRECPPEHGGGPLPPGLENASEAEIAIKCEVETLAKTSTQEHGNILARIKEIKKAIDDLVNKIITPFITQHAEDTNKIKDAVGLGPGEMPIDQQIGVKPGEKSIANRLDDLKAMVGKIGHDIWDRIGTGGAVVGGATGLALVGVALEARKRLRRRFQIIDESFTKVGDGLKQLSTDIQDRVDQLSTQVQDRFGQLQQTIAGLQPPPTAQGGEGEEPGPQGGNGGQPGAGGEGGAGQEAGAGAGIEIPEPVRFTDEQLQVLARSFEFLDRIFNTVDELSDSEISHKITAASMTKEQVNTFRQALIQSIMILSEEEVDEEELKGFSTVRLIRRLSVRRRAISQAEALRIATVREQLRAQGQL